MIQRTVCFSLVHAEGSDAERAFLVRARTVLAALPGVQDFTIDRRVSPGSAFRFRFSMRFADDRAYREHRTHPDHVAFVAEHWVGEVTGCEEFDVTPW